MRALVPLFLAAVSVAADAPAVLVAPFENLSGVRQVVDYEVGSVPGGQPGGEQRKMLRVDRLSDAPRSLLEDRIVNLGGKVVERQRVNDLLQEADFVRVSGLANPGDAIRWGKMAGAKAILVGTIGQIKVETREFQGYGVTVRRAIASAEVRVRLVDGESGRVRWSRTVTGSAEKTDTQHGQSSDSDTAYNVVKDAVDAIAKDSDLSRILRGE